jgi:uncharacterized protein
VDTLKQKISADFLQAFKSGDKVKKNLLGVVKGEITTVEKNTNSGDLSDAEVTKILNKIAKNLKETIAQANSEEAKAELSVIEAYLPKQMTEAEIRVAVEQIIAETGASSPGEMGKVMGGFNAKYAGQADGKIVSVIVKELLLTKV